MYPEEIIRLYDRTVINKGTFYKMGEVHYFFPFYLISRFFYKKKKNISLLLYPYKGNCAAL